MPESVPAASNPEDAPAPAAPSPGPPRGLLIDFGGVLTSNLFEAFGDFAVAEGLERDALARPDQTQSRAPRP